MVSGRCGFFAVRCRDCGQQSRSRTAVAATELEVVAFLLSCCFTSTETIRLIMDGRMEVEEEGNYIPIATLSPPE